MNSFDPNSLTDDQKQKLDQLTGVLLKRVFMRVAHVLTAEDLTKIEELDKNDQEGQAVKYFLISKVPNFEAILDEEIQKLKQT